MDAQSRRERLDLYSFAAFTLDIPNRGLAHGTRPVHLAPNPMTS